MADETAARILGEIRDLLREQGVRQQQAVAQQLKAIQTQRRVLRLIVPAIGGVILVIGVLLLRLLGMWSCR